MGPTFRAVLSIIDGLVLVFCMAAFMTSGDQILPYIFYPLLACAVINLWVSALKFLAFLAVPAFIFFAPLVYIMNKPYGEAAARNARMEFLWVMWAIALSISVYWFVIGVPHLTKGARKK
jgi:hypothetical protein